MVRSLIFKAATGTHVGILEPGEAAQQVALIKTSTEGHLLLILTQQ